MHYLLPGCLKCHKFPSRAKQTGHWVAQKKDTRQRNAGNPEKGQGWVWRDISSAFHPSNRSQEPQHQRKNDFCRSSLGRHFWLFLFAKSHISVNLEPRGPAHAELCHYVMCVHISRCRPNSLSRTWNNCWASPFTFSCLTWQCFHSNVNSSFWIWLLFGTGFCCKENPRETRLVGLWEEVCRSLYVCGGNTICTCGLAFSLCLPALGHSCMGRKSCCDFFFFLAQNLWSECVFQGNC